jgi:hypothetical protein
MQPSTRISIDVNVYDSSKGKLKTTNTTTEMKKKPIRHND